jgi:uncharacterized protein
MPAPAPARVPGVYLLPEAPSAALPPEPMDVCGFVGVAPRGPAWELVEDTTWATAGRPARARSVAVPVESWDDYEERFGGCEGPGLLPHAVAAFFGQGGRRAWVVRVVPDGPAPAGDPPGCTVLVLGRQVRTGADGSVRLRARNEGSWGDRVEARLSWRTRPLPLPGVEGAALVLPAGAAVEPGSRLRLASAEGVAVLRRVTTTVHRPFSDRPGGERLALLDAAPGLLPAAVDIVEAVLDVVDRDPSRSRQERHTGLGLAPEHPRWLGAVLEAESRLVALAAGVGELRPADPGLAPAESSVDRAGDDRAAQITPAAVLGTADLPDDAPPGGVAALLDAPEVATVVVPDLYSPAEAAEHSDVGDPLTLAGGGFAPCVVLPPRVAAPVAPPPPLPGLRRDPGLPADLADITALQRRLVAFGERSRLAVLLDVPPGLALRRALAWRAGFDSSYAAVYGPWPRAVPPGGGGLVRVPPSAFAAGVIARVERAEGLARGPAHVLLGGAVDVPTALGHAEHDALHAGNVNVLRLDRDGVRLLGARTTSTARAWRALTTRRIVTSVERTLERQMAWAVFEPNSAALRADLRVRVEHLLQDLFARGAFAGASPADSFFVRTADGPALALESDAGVVLCEIGLAPAEPAEYLLVRLVRDGDGGLRATSEAGRG